MIRIECENCKTVLSIDDAFAGGVCRCQRCGTIQTVPKKGAASVAANPSATSDPSSQKTLFKRKARIGSALSPYNDELDKVADSLDSASPLSPSAIANLSNSSSRAGEPSPGSSDSGLNMSTESRRPAAAVAQARPAASASSAPPKSSHYTPRPQITRPSAASAVPSNSTPHSSRAMMIGVGAAVVVVGTVGWFLLRSGPSTPADTPKPHPASTAPQHLAPPVPATSLSPVPASAPTPATTPAPIATTDAGPSAFGISLKGPRVVYILDRTGCPQDQFQKLLEGVYRSIGSLPETDSFQIVLWNSSPDLAYPAIGLAPANSASIESARAALAGTTLGSSEISLILNRGLESQPNEVVLVSALDLDQLAAVTICSTVAARPVVIHTVATSALVGDGMATVARTTHGQFRQFDLATLP